MIKLNPNFSDYVLQSNTPDNFFISKINIFVGANNSGKSRFLRKLITDKKYNYRNYDDSLLEQINKFIEYHEQRFNIIKNHLRGNKFSNNNLNVAFDGIKLLFEEKIKKLTYIPINLPISEYNNLFKLNKVLSNINQNTYKEHENQDLLDRIITEFDERMKNFKKIYIPTLRSIRSLDYICKAKEEIDNRFTESKLDRNITFDNDFFKARTMIDYWNNPKETPYYVTQNRQKKYTFENYESHIGIDIITGLSLYDDITDMLLGDSDERKTITEWEGFLSQHFFDNSSISITPNRKDSILKLKIDDDEKPIFDLGDGLQTLLIITFALFCSKHNKTLFSIEEPEMFLHPSYQRKLIEILLLPEFDKIQYFVTTHSNHFLDLTIDFPNLFNVYHFEKVKKKFIVENKSSNQLKNVISSLGVKPSSLYLANCIILVEGISDIIYIRKYLELYMKSSDNKKYIIDRHFAFMEYGGSNIEHWSFLDGDIESESINPNIMVIADNDGQFSENEALLLKSNKISNIKYEDNTKKERLIKLYKLDYSVILNVREIENLIDGDILRKVIIDKEKKFKQKIGSFRKVDESLIPVFNQETYKNKYLGMFIDLKLTKHRNKNGGYLYSNKKSSGTIKQKNEFSRLVTEKITNFNQLTEEAKELTREIYKFIDKFNKTI